VLELVGISKHQYYYKSKGSRSGKAKSKTTLKQQGSQKVEVPNGEVVNQIKQLQSNPDLACGYHRMHAMLILMGFYINHKKVYRLMKENHLLAPKRMRKKKNYAQYRVVVPKAPLEVLEMDIKYFYIVKDQRQAFVLTVIDTFTRVILGWRVGFTMNAYQVEKLWEQIIIQYLQPWDLLNMGVHLEIRNDNGPQFSAKSIEKFFKQNYINQVFTHPYTPQENGHIESFHAILSKATQNQNFWSLTELEYRLVTFYRNYNLFRSHASIAGLPPIVFWNLWLQNKILTTTVARKKLKFKVIGNIQQLSGNGSLREVPCLENMALDEPDFLLLNEMKRPRSSLQPSVQRSPSVVPC